MAQLKTNISINYIWWMPTTKNVGKEINPEHQEQLAEDAMNHIFEMMGAGYTSGLLNAELDSGESDATQYNGYWEVTTKRKG